MTSTPFRLIDLETEPLEPVEFPNGHVYEVRPLGVEEHRLFEELAVHHDVPRAIALLRSVLPGVTDADLSLLTPRMVTAIVMHARHQLDAVLDTMQRGGSLADLSSAAVRGRTKPPAPVARRSRIVQ